MSTNGDTRLFIVERASELASQVGLTGLSIGSVARSLARPKSAVLFHFQSKEALQLAILHNAARELYRDVTCPALQEPDGLPQLERLFDRWLEWCGRGCYPGGCLFVAGAAEFDDQPGPVRDHLVRLYQVWHHLVGHLVRAALSRGALRPTTDIEQFLQELHGIMLGYHHRSRLFHDPGAERRARLAFQGLVERARPNHE